MIDWVTVPGVLATCAGVGLWLFSPATRWQRAGHLVFEIGLAWCIMAQLDRAQPQASLLMTAALLVLAALRWWLPAEESEAAAGWGDPEFAPVSPQAIIVVDEQESET